MCSYGQLKGKISPPYSSTTTNSSQSSSSRYCTDSKSALTLSAIWEFFPFVFRINDNGPGQTTLTILEQVCKERGWKQFGEDDDTSARQERGLWNWNLWWKSVAAHHPTRSLYSWQYTNHIPKAINFCNKEYLASYMRIMESRFGEVFYFSPQTFTLPRETEELAVEHQRRSEMKFMEHRRGTAQNLVPIFKRKQLSCGHESGDFHHHNNQHHNEEIINFEDAEEKIILESQRNFRPVWICKPVGKSQGRGIVIIDNLTNLPDHPVTVVQEYIAQPFLISGYKFDLRLYVSIVSISPLTIYVYREGLTRFATEPYDLSDLTKVCSHLTNASLNKLSPGYEEDKIVVGHGCKWTLQKLRQHLKSAGHTDWLTWQKIMSIIVLTILGEVGQHVGKFPASRNSFEFLGLDLLIDQSLRPWLLESNLSPGLGGDSIVDQLVKKPMLHELFSLLGLPDGRPFVQVVPTTVVKKNTENLTIDIDVESNTAIQLRNEVQQRGNDQQQIDRAEGRQIDPLELDKLSEKEKQQPEGGGGNKKKQKDTISPNLQKRLLDATAIYSQNLKVPLPSARSWKKTPNSNSSQSNSKCSTATSNPETFSEFSATAETEAARLNFLASTDWIGTLKAGGRTGSFKSSSLDGAGGVGLHRRSWYDAPARHGDWVLIFPFDSCSFQMTRGHLGMDIKAMVHHLEQYLNFVENLCLAYPSQSDEYYSNRVNEAMNWNKILWVPPS